MKVTSVVISSCRNGWMVAPWPPLEEFQCGGGTPTRQEYWVYRDLQELQADLPKLLGQAGPVCNPAPDIPET